MIERIKSANQRVELYDEKKAWVEIFDPSTSEKLRSKLKKALRHGAEESIKTWQSAMKFQGGGAARTSKLLRERNLPDGMTVAAVMTSGFCCTEVYAYLNADSRADRLIFIGYSSGLHDASKMFSDGTPMAGKIFIMREDLQFLRRNSAAPLLFADIRVETGLTMATLGHSLKHHLSYSGNMYQLEIYGIPKPWTGEVDTKHYWEAPHLPMAVPIVTDALKAISR